MPLQEALLLGFGEKALHETVSAVSALPTWSLASQLPERQMNGSDGLAACVAVAQHGSPSLKRTTWRLFGRAGRWDQDGTGRSGSL